MGLAFLCYLNWILFNVVKVSMSWLVHYLGYFLVLLAQGAHPLYLLDGLVANEADAWWVRFGITISWMRYSNKIKSLRFVYSCSPLLISFIFNLNGENLARAVRDLNVMRRMERWMKQDLNGAVFPKIWVLPMLVTISWLPCLLGGLL